MANLVVLLSTLLVTIATAASPSVAAASPVSLQTPTIVINAANPPVTSSIRPENHTAEHLLREFLRCKEPLDVCLLADGKPYSVKFLIATVPEPVQPELRYIFDAQFDAIQHAIEEVGYVYDRSDLLWPSPSDNVAPAAIVQDAAVEPVPNAKAAPA